MRRFHYSLSGALQEKQWPPSPAAAFPQRARLLQEEIRLGVNMAFV